MPPLDSLLLALGKGALVLGLALLVARLARDQSAARRHLLWLATFGILLALPFTASLEPKWGLLPPESERELTNSSNVVVASTVARIDAPAFTNPPPNADAMPALHTSRVRLSDALMHLWIFGVVAVLAATLPAHVRLLSLRRRCSRCSDERIQAIALQTASGLRHDAGFDLLTLPEGSRVPLAWGLLRPVIALPAESASWSDDWLRSALRHELGHLVRRDPWWRLLSRVICALHWPNPLVWLAARRWRLAQEQACDDLALDGVQEPARYAEQLVELAHRLAADTVPSHRAALGMANPGSLGIRLRAVIDATRDRRPASLAFSLCGLAFAAVLAAGLAFTGLRADTSTVSQTAETSVSAVVDTVVAGTTPGELEDLKLPPLEFNNTPFDEAVKRLHAAILATKPERTITVSLTAPDDAVLPRVHFRTEGTTSLKTILSGFGLSTGVHPRTTENRITFDISTRVPPRARFSGDVLLSEENGQTRIRADRAEMIGTQGYSTRITAAYLRTLRLPPIQFDDLPLDEAVAHLEHTVRATIPGLELPMRTFIPEGVIPPRVAIRTTGVSLYHVLNGIAYTTGVIADVGPDRITFDLSKQQTEYPFEFRNAVVSETEDGKFKISGGDLPVDKPAKRAASVPSTPSVAAQASQIKRLPQARVSILFVSLTADAALPKELSDPSSLKGADVLSAPTVVTSHRNPAEVTIGEELTFTDMDGQEKTRTIGVNAKVLPEIQPDGITLDLEATLTSLEGHIENAKGRFPVISSRSVNTRVTLPGDGKRWVTLGGLQTHQTPAQNLAVLVTAERLESSDVAVPAAAPQPTR